jgi:predicted ABC-type transport system involved in lysophospholipase L1 biosynthesis ATPase subunit
MLHPDGPVLPTMSPTISEDGHHHHSDEVETVQKEGEKANITTESTSGESSSTTVTAGIEKEKAEEDLELRQRKTVATTTDSTN